MYLAITADKCYVELEAYKLIENNLRIVFLGGKYYVKLITSLESH